MTGDSSVDIQSVIPPDDAGRDAFERFRYQAHLTFPDCLNCVTQLGVTAVICEHFEDVCIEEEGQVRLRQIKTRNLDYGLWRLADLCSERGAFRSLLRSHRALSEIDDDRSFIYEVSLEGALERRDAICQFLPRGEGADDALARRVIKLMKPHTELRLAEAREVLRRVRIRPTPPRGSIVAINKELLASIGGDLPAAELSQIYDQVIEVICQAMSGTRLREWPAILFSGDDSPAKALIEAKRLDQAVLERPLEPVLSGATPSLREITDPDALSASALELKLRLAGAPPELIDRAKQLRANMTYREIELRSRSLRQDIDLKLEDLRERLKAVADISLSVSGSGAKPAPAVFADVFERLGAQPATYDPARLYNRDPTLLMGGVCDLSDQCLFAWRSSE
jgi:Cap4, dsDNA endonuclease domain